jgi:hypothetical protein
MMTKQLTRSGPSLSKAFFAADWLAAEQWVSSVTATQSLAVKSVRSVSRGAHNSLLAPIAGVLLASAGVLLGSLSAPAKATASYQGNLTINILFPPAETNLFGFASPFGAITTGSSNEFFNPQALAFFTPGTITGSSSTKISGTEVEGFATASYLNPFVRATSQSFGSFGARLGNLSGGGFPTPPPTSFTATFNVEIAYDLKAIVDDLTSEYSDVSFDFFASTSPDGNVVGDRLVDSIMTFGITSNDSQASKMTGTFGVVIPPNSVEEVYFYYNLRGQAEATAVPPIEIPPELPPQFVPGPLPILGAAAAFGYSRKLRKHIKASKPEVISATAV